MTFSPTEGRAISPPAGSRHGTASMIRQGRQAPAPLTAKRSSQHALDPAYVPFDPFYDRPDKNPLAINEGELYQYTVELWPTCNVFKKGHRIRVSLSGSDFPHLLPVISSVE